MADKIVKQQVIIFNADGIPQDVTPYVQNWTISNGGMGKGATGLDGVVVTGNLTLMNDEDTNFNPEAEYGVLETEILPFVGNGTSTYAGVPSDGWVKAVGFNRIVDGTVTTWDDLTTWDAYTDWGSGTGTTDNSQYYGDIQISGSNFITPKVIPSTVYFEIIFTYMDYSQRNPINTFDDEYSPLLDENSRIKIFALVEDISWMSYYWVADGTNTFPNPTDGTPLVAGVGIMTAATQGEWDDTTTWDAWTSWEQYDTPFAYSTNAYYDYDTSSIILANTPTTGTALTFSISYYEGTPEMIFSGYLGDSIETDAQNRSINLSFRDKGKLLQDTMIDNVINVVDPSGWTIFSNTDSEIINITDVISSTGVFKTDPAHGLITGDTIAFNQIETLPLKNDGTRLVGSYDVTVTSTTEFTLDGVTFTEKTTSIPLIVSYTLYDTEPSIFVGIPKLTRDSKKEEITGTLNYITDELTFTLNYGSAEDYSISYVYYNGDSGLIAYRPFKWSPTPVKIYIRKGDILADYSTGTISAVVSGTNLNVTVDFLDNYEDINEVSATARKVKDIDEIATPISTIEIVSPWKITTSSDHLLTDGDIIQLTSTNDLPEDTSGDLQQLYEVEVIDDTNIKIYERDSFGALDQIEFTSAGTGTRNVVKIQLDVIEVIDNILRDLNKDNGTGTLPEVTYNVDIDTGFNRSVGLNTDIWDSKTVWDTLQSLASMKALYIAYLWNITSQDYILTIKNIESKTTADFTLESNEIFVQTQDITGADIRNSIFVNYYNSTQGQTRETISAQDSTSIARYGARPSVITESKTSAINNPTIAAEFAEAILAVSKDRVIESTATVPFMFEYTAGARIEPGITVSLINRYLDNQTGITPFYAIESIEHSYANFLYRTTFRGNKQKVRTSVRRYQEIESRPGAFRQQTGRDISELYQIPAVTGLSAITTGLEATNLTPTAYAIIAFTRPSNYYPAFYTLRYWKSSETVTEGREIKIDNTSSVIVTQRLELEPKTEYKCEVYAWSKANVKGITSSELTIAEIGDSTAPYWDMTYPLGLAVVGLDESVQISFNDIPYQSLGEDNADFLAYNIYAKEGAAPTTGAFDYKKTTTSTTTVLSDLTPGNYYIGVTAFDTSGNESAMASIVTAKISPRYVVRTQAQLDAFFTLHADGNYNELPFEEVLIYHKDTKYTISGVDFRVEQEYFLFQGVGLPEIELDNSADFRWRIGGGGIKGFKITDTAVGSSLIAISDSSSFTDTTLTELSDNYIELEDAFAIYVGLGNGAKFECKNNTINAEQDFLSIDPLPSFSGSALIQNNKYINNDVIIRNFLKSTIFEASTIANIMIIDNEIENGQILFTGSLNTETLTLRRYTVKDNYSKISLDSDYSFIELFVGGTGANVLTFKDSTIKDNTIDIDTPSSKTINFLWFRINATVTADMTNFNLFDNNLNDNVGGNTLNWIKEDQTVTKGATVRTKNNSPLLAFTEKTIGTTATTATAGAQTLPANPVGFWELILNNTLYKIPYYSN